MFSINQSVFKTKVAAFITALIVAMIAAHAAQAAGQGVISAARLHVRLKPEKASRSTGILTKGTRVRVVSILKSGWLEIKSDNINGYIRNRPRYVHLFKEKRKKVRKKGKAGAKTGTKKNKNDMGKIAREIETRRSEANDYENKEAEIINDLHLIDRILNQTKGEVSHLKKEISTFEREIRANLKEIKILKKKSRREKKYITERLVALYKMGRLAPGTGFAGADNIYEQISKKSGLSRILDADAEIMDNYISHMQRLNLLKNGLETRKRERLEFRDEVKTKLATIRRRKKRRSDLLSNVKNKKSLTIAAIKSLEDAARKLKQTLLTADKGIRRKEGSKKSAKSTFRNTRGHLPLPVNGKIVSRFGQATDKKMHIKTFQNGINIKADKGEPVRAVEGGTVLFADWLKGYGNLIIINHGNSYYTLYAHADELFKEKGDMVENLEVIATVGDTGLLGNPGLHFEIRHRGTPVDPINWLAKR